VLTSARGVSRRTSKGTVIGAEQSLPFEDWLRAYTAGAAYAGGQEHERGRLVPGLRADLVVLDGATGAAFDADDPPRVVETWVSGARVHVSA
jgi:predicted amidohydrolase YtcJ